MMYAVASGFLPFLSLLSLAKARTFWSSSPATHGAQNSDEYLLKSGYPLGNGRLGAIPFGEPGAEKIALNIDSLWSGGPFESSSYRGGNPTDPKYQALPGIRESIWKDGTGNVDALYGSGAHYGSYRVAANLTISIDYGDAFWRNYRRTLDLEQGTYQTWYSVGKRGYTTDVFCSYPSHVCVYRITCSGFLPAISVSFENQLVDPSLVTASCNSKEARFTGYTQAGPPRGMKYDMMARISGGEFRTECSKAGVLTIHPVAEQYSVTLVIGAATNFDQTKGNAANKYSFKGQDPAAQVEAVTAAAARQSYESLASKHAADYKSLFGAFSLTLPDPKGSAEKQTAEVISNYAANGTSDPFVENLLFDLGRYMLITSSREDSLPANLQGRWAEELRPAWSADYHANINTQMNYWMADQTGLSRTQVALWNYMQYNWVPRGTETAKLLYGAKGWVVHNEMNIFGHTGMKDSATWANYPAAAAWMMQHVWDNFEYTQDVNWLRNQGYPLLKGVAEFWLSQLQKDAFTKDDTLVVNPCNSPEQGPTTFGCTHYQQVIYQVFEATLAASALVGERDKSFIKDVTNKLAILDHGVHISNWGGIKEWKLPDSYGIDGPNTHRHLSHLVGWHPGYSIASFDGGYTNATIQAAVSKTLQTRGKGTGDDANAGWEKVWRSACWARLNNTAEAYDALRYAIATNFAGNGFSMYDGLSAPFQIEANFGLGGAMLSMLVVDLPVAHTADQRKARTVVLGPAIPSVWGGGSVQGLRLRGGRSVDFSWGSDGKVNKATLRGSGKGVIVVNVDGKLLAK